MLVAMASIFRLFALAFVVTLPLALMSCGKERVAAPGIERAGERCDSFEMGPDGSGRIAAAGASFIPLDGFDAQSCLDDEGWLFIDYSAAHGNDHALVTRFGIMELEQATADLVTSQNRVDMLWALAADSALVDQADPRCLEFEAASSGLSIPGIDCATWEERWLDIAVPGAEGEEWPMQVRSALCFDSSEPPVYLVWMSWSERHAPGVEGLSELEVEQQSFDFLTSLRFGED